MCKDGRTSSYLKMEGTDKYCWWEGFQDIARSPSKDKVTSGSSQGHMGQGQSREVKFCKIGLKFHVNCIFISTKFVAGHKFQKCMFIRNHRSILTSLKLINTLKCRIVKYANCLLFVLFCFVFGCWDPSEKYLGLKNLPLISHSDVKMDGEQLLSSQWIGPYCLT